MTNWLDEYLDALESRDAYEKANEVATNAYTRLADRHAEFHKAIAKGSSFPHPNHPDSPNPKTKTQLGRVPPSVVGSPAPRSPSPTSPKPSQSKDNISQESVLSIREDLASANRTIHNLRAKIATLESEISALTAQSGVSKNKSTVLQDTIRRLQAENASFARKLRDRESELKEKARLVESVQDEMLGLEMQVNVAEEKVNRLKEENGELVERWMKRIGDEADQMNVGSGWK